MDGRPHGRKKVAKDTRTPTSVYRKRGEEYGHWLISAVVVSLYCIALYGITSADWWQDRIEQDRTGPFLLCEEWVTVRYDMNQSITSNFLARAPPRHTHQRGSPLPTTVFTQWSNPIQSTKWIGTRLTLLVLAKHVWIYIAPGYGNLRNAHTRPRW